MGIGEEEKSLNLKIRKKGRRKRKADTKESLSVEHTRGEVQKMKEASAGPVGFERLGTKRQPGKSSEGGGRVGGKGPQPFKMI